MDAAVQKAGFNGTSARRGFAQLHRDVWRVVRTAPVIFVVLPAVVWLPFDVLTESVALAKPAGSWEQFRVYLRLGQVGGAVVGTFTSAVFLAALIDLAGRRRPTLSRALREGLGLWFPIFSVWFLATVYIGLGMILLVIPGIVLFVRYALILPVTAFEKALPKEALKRSAACVQQGPRSVVLGVTGAALLYLPLMFAPTFLVPGAAGVWVGAVASVPLNVFFGFLTIGLTLLYVDLREESGLAAPVGFQLDPSDVGIPPAQSSGKRGVVTALAASGASLVLGVLGFQLLVLAPISDGDAAWAREAHREALGHYERAVYWDPADAYAHYSIGWCHSALDELPEALSAFRTAIELEPDNPIYQLDRVRMLIRMDRLTEARSALSAARQLEGVDEGVVEELQASLSTP